MATQRNALVVRGGWEGHEPVATSVLFIPFLKESGFNVSIENNLEVYADPQIMADTDLIIQCWTMGEILSEELDGLREAMENGTGFDGWHGGEVDDNRISSE